MKSLTSSLATSHGGFTLLAPLGGTIPPCFRYRLVEDSVYHMLLGEMQRFRGKVYLDDGAISKSELQPDSRHAVQIDGSSWHLLRLNPEGRVCGCVRITEQANAQDFDQLWMRHCELARSARWGHKLRRAIESEMMQARRERLWFAEIGGLAIAPERRCTADSLRTILATFGLLELFGGSKSVATVTRRHECAPILRRIGLAPLVFDGEELPSYYDPQYGCEMEVLRLDSRFPNSKYQGWIAELGAYLRTVPMISGAKPDPEKRPLPIPAQWPVLAPKGSGAWDPPAAVAVV